MKELRDHVKTQPSYHPPGPPYTYQEPKFNVKHELFESSFYITGSGTEKIFKGKTFEGLKGIWKVFFGNPPLEQSEEKRRKNR